MQVFLDRRQQLHQLFDLLAGETPGRQPLCLADGLDDGVEAGACFGASGASPKPGGNSDSGACCATTGKVNASAAVPTAVDAGESSALPEWARSPLSLTLISFVLVLAGAAIVLRNRSRA